MKIKLRIYPLVWGASLGLVQAFAYKYQTRVEMSYFDKHSSLLVKIASYKKLGFMSLVAAKKACFKFYGLNKFLFQLPQSQSY